MWGSWRTRRPWGRWARSAWRCHASTADVDAARQPIPEPALSYISNGSRLRRAAMVEPTAALCRSCHPKCWQLHRLSSGGQSWHGCLA